MSGEHSWLREGPRRPTGSAGSSSQPQAIGGVAGPSSQQHHHHGSYSSSYEVGPSSSAWESVQPPPAANPKRRTTSSARPRSVSSASITSSAKSEAQKDRVAMACLHCRSRKVRCDGGQPRCGLCSRLNRSCSYARVTEAENLVLRTRKRELKARRHNRDASSASTSSQPPRANSEGEEGGWSSVPASLSGLPGHSPTTSRPRASTGGTANSNMSAYRPGLPLLSTSALAGNPELTARVPGHHIGCYCERCAAMRTASGYSTSSGTASSSSHGSSPSQVLASSTSYVGVPGWMSPTGNTRPSSAGLSQPGEPASYAGPAGSLGVPSSTTAWPSTSAEGAGTVSPPSTLANRYGYEAPLRERAYTTSAFSASSAHELHSPSSFSTSPTSAWGGHQHASSAGRARSSSNNVVPTVLRAGPVAPGPMHDSMYDAPRRTAMVVSPKSPQETFHETRSQHAPGSMPPPDHWSSYARSTQREEQPMRREVTDQLADATSHVSLERAAIESQFGTMAAPAPAPLPRTFAAPTPVYPPGSHTLWQGQGGSLSPHAPPAPPSHESSAREEANHAGNNFFHPPAAAVAEPPPQSWHLYNNAPTTHEGSRYRPTSFHSEDRYESESQPPFQPQLPPQPQQQQHHHHSHQQHQ